MVRIVLYFLLGLPVFLFPWKDSSLQGDRILADKRDEPQHILKSTYKVFDLNLESNFKNNFKIIISELTGEHIYTDSFESAEKGTKFQFYLKDVPHKLVKYAITRENRVVKEGFLY